MSIGAVKAVEIGDGVAVTKVLGSENNDAFFAEGTEKDIAVDQMETAVVKEDEAEADYSLGDNSLSLKKKTNHSGGILGGMSDGSELILRACFKPTPSIGKLQNTVKENGEATAIKIMGRHDPTVVERAAVVVEAMTAIVILDCLLENMSARIENIKKVYRKG